VKRFTVIVANSVWDQIDNQAIYIAQGSIQNAIAWQARLRVAIEDIGDMPSTKTRANGSAEQSASWCSRGLISFTTA